MANKTNKHSGDNKKTPLTAENAVVQDTSAASKPIFLWFAVDESKSKSSGGP